MAPEKVRIGKSVRWRRVLTQSLSSEVSLPPVDLGAEILTGLRRLGLHHAWSSIRLS